jgi:hypothetical protein
MKALCDTIPEARHLIDAQVRCDTCKRGHDCHCMCVKVDVEETARLNNLDPKDLTSHDSMGCNCQALFG